MKSAPNEILIGITPLIAGVVVISAVANLYTSRFGLLPDLALLLTALLAFAWIFVDGFEIERIATFILISALLIVLYISMSLYHLSFGGIRNSVSLFCVTVIFVFFFQYAREIRSSLNFELVLLFCVALTLLLPLFSLGVPKNQQNSAAFYLIIALFICHTRQSSVSGWKVLMLFVTAFAISVVNDHRTLAGLSLLVPLQYWLLSLNLVPRLTRFLMFVGVFFACVALVALLIDPDMLLLADAFDRFVTNQGERRILSGRQVIWPAVWSAVVANPILGLDPGASAGSLYMTDLSAHNLYLEVALQLGFVGLSLLILMIWSLWRLTMPSGRIDRRPEESFATVVVTLVAVHSLFDVFLTQDSLSAGVPAWIALGLGLGSLTRDTSAPAVARLYLEGRNFNTHP